MDMAKKKFLRGAEATEYVSIAGREEWNARSVRGAVYVSMVRRKSRCKRCGGSTVYV
jgi:transposase